MKPSLQTRLGQQLTLTPQLRQAIRLLQLSTVELEAELELALQNNPMLERIEELEPEAGPAPEAAEGIDDDAKAIAEQEAAYSYEDTDPPHWEWEPNPRGNGHDGDYDPTQFIAVREDLHDHLYGQLHLGHFSERDRRIGMVLIEAIGEDGYLDATLEEIRQALGEETNVEDAEILAVLHAIQRFDPAGVGARDLSECLLAQLATLPPDTPGIELARRVAREHLGELARHGPERLAQHLAAEPAAVAQAVSLLRTLHPKPGLRLDTAEPEYIRPDCVSWREGGVWRVALAADGRPRLGINRRYQNLIARVGREDASYLRAQLQEARWLLRSLDTRAETMLRVARSIVRQQVGFLEHGPEAMRPLTLREVAVELGLHESTVSRASTRKYLRTPRGTFEFRYFFSSGVATGEGGANSATAIQAMLKRLIDNEDPRHPLSDAKLAAELEARGVPVARRTVAKYREAMNIPASNERQRLG